MEKAQASAILTLIRNLFTVSKKWIDKPASEGLFLSTVDRLQPALGRVLRNCA